MGAKEESLLCGFAHDLRFSFHLVTEFDDVLGGLLEEMVDERGKMKDDLLVVVIGLELVFGPCILIRL